VRAQRANKVMSWQWRRDQQRCQLRWRWVETLLFLVPDVQTKEIDTMLERQKIQNNASIRLRNSLPGRFIPNILPIPHLLDGSINKNIGKIKRRLDNLRW